MDGAIITPVSSGFDVEGSCPLKAVQVDSLVVLKIIKHSRESFTSHSAAGQLLGLDINGVLQVTNSFPLSHGHEGENASSLAQNRISYMQQMMRCLKEIGVDNNVVGWYQSVNSGTFINMNLIENQFSYHQALNDMTVMLVYDASQSTHESLSLKAFRLTPSFIAAKKEGKFNAESISKYGLSHSNVFEELPLIIHNSHLAVSLLHYLDSRYRFVPTAPALSLLPLSFSFDNLEPVVDSYFEKIMENLLEVTEDYQYEQSNYQYYQRALAREQLKIQQWLQKRRAENAVRAANNQSLLPEDEWQRLFKLSSEPSLLESILLASQIDYYCKKIDSSSAPALTKLYASIAK
ncbi:uncharacterized protein T551_01245 [Pneumocystis jirovecii RU7]|uniref:Eukaryotic translation initiation factor 3 subunit H n=1 Tax=Pneumocystis jirovecii (strain RU7) TaxID=1408657 RepID=A0A0W4ZS38_PNEJ7|nr:uncharacterized protein T551_01245 [Pneumocystis jirovecii RU7]KTW31172.1 hypothetical protein T551_01245 [Pneumocystis jirovecii RU7]